jgi:hypothetical protein
VNSPPPSGPQPQEQIAFADILAGYQRRVSELEHDLVLAQCRIDSRDKEIERLFRELDKPQS